MSTRILSLMPSINGELKLPIVNNDSAIDQRLALIASNTELVWKRNPAWPTYADPANTEDKIILLFAVHPASNAEHGSNFAAVGVSGANGYTVDWGDGSSPSNYTTGTVGYYRYDYTSATLANSDAPVTFTDAGDLVNLTAHSYANNDRVAFWEIVSTTGLVEGRQYFVINTSTNSFQVSSTRGGAAVTLTTDGSGKLLPYKIAKCTITPRGANTLNQFNLAPHNQAGLVGYGQTTNVLEAVISMPNSTTAGAVAISVGGSSNLWNRYLERVKIVYSNTSSRTWTSAFKNCAALQKLEFGTGFTPIANNTQDMFNGCSALREVPLFDTSVCANFSIMFGNCYSLITVPLFDTSAATTLSQMFSGCSALATIPPFNSAGVTSFLGMFQSCAGLLSIPYLNTSNGTDFSSMFYGCLGLQSVPRIDTSKAANTAGMFQQCRSLKVVPRLETGNTTNMANMFNECYSMTEAPQMNTSKVANTQQMFYDCRALKTIPNYEFGNTTNMYYMFYLCQSLEQLPALNTSKVTNMQSTFTGCAKLISVPQMDFSNVTNMSTTFQSCTSMRTWPNLNTSKVTNFQSTFAYCTAMTLPPVIDSSNATSVASMFAGCTNLVAAPPLYTDKVTNMNGIFTGCEAIRIYPNLQHGNAQASGYSSHFSQCYNLSRFLSTSLANTFSISGCSFSNTGLNEMYTNLPSVTGKTVTVTGNYGTTGDDPTIATAKGWTVTG